MARPMNKNRAKTGAVLAPMGIGAAVVGAAEGKGVKGAAEGVEVGAG